MPYKIEGIKKTIRETINAHFSRHTQSHQLQTNESFMSIQMYVKNE